MRATSTYKIVLTSLFAALVCVATMLIRIPSPISGYINLGDGFALLGAFLLGPIWGGAAAGLGSMLADVLAGYAMYAPGTLVIKGALALAAGKLYHRHADGNLKMLVTAGICGELLMVAGYFLYSGVFLGYGLAAAAEIPGNLCQGAAGIVVAALLTPALNKSREVREMLAKMK